MQSHLALRGSANTAPASPRSLYFLSLLLLCFPFIRSGLLPRDFSEGLKQNLGARFQCRHGPPALLRQIKEWLRCPALVPRLSHSSLALRGEGSKPALLSQGSLRQAGRAPQEKPMPSGEPAWDVAR